MKHVNIEDINDLGLGASLLGSGGGGSADYEMLMAEKHLMEYGPVQLASFDELQKDDLVLPIAIVGAPLVGLEVLPSGRECEIIIELIEKFLGRKPTHLMPAEIGGGNSLCPFLFASRLNLPILDADTVGRAFPELQMSSCNLHNVPVNPAFLVDPLDNSVMINANDALTLEEITRKNVVAMGSSAIIGVYLMDGFTAKKAVIHGSISRAIQLGKSIRNAKSTNKDPIQALVKDHYAQILGSGVITNISQAIDEGFLNGTVTIMADDGMLEIFYQNEYLKVEKSGRSICLTPSIISIIDADSAQPISSEKLLFGLRVTVLALPPPSLWLTSPGLKLVGPHYFGYETTEGTL